MRGLLLALVLLGGCYRVRLTGEPDNASVLLADGSSRGLPTGVRVGPNPFRATEVQVTAPGHRALELRLRWHRFVLRRVREVHVQLVEEHGPSGTWTR